MNKIILVGLALVVVSIFGIGYAMAGQNNSVDNSDYLNAQNLIANIEKAPLSEEEEASLIRMREEEKLARDVYLTLAEKWSLRIFSNIAKSEQTHTNAVKALLDRYGIEDPVKEDTIGVFTSPELQKLYNDLVAQGSKSLLDALEAGATVEDLDIKDLEEFLKVTDNDDIKIIYQNLMKGSRNHLRAFIRNLKRNGGTYKPQFISEDDYNKILSTPSERGALDVNGKPMNMNNKNQGKGKGNKKGQNKGYGQKLGYGKAQNQHKGNRNCKNFNHHGSGMMKHSESGYNNH